MGQSELQTAYRNWARRVAQYTQLGIPSAAYTPIAQQDMNKVATNQGAGMTNEQAAAAVYAAASRQNPIQSQQALAGRHRHGLIGGLEDLAGNITSDVSHMILGAPAGVAHLAASLVTPGGIKHDWHDIQNAGRDIGQGDFGKALRDAAAMPALDLIPGVADFAALTTAAGRHQLATHPVSSVLDVMPYTKPLTAMAGVNLAAKAGSDALTEALGQASNWNKIRGKVDVRSEDPSALAAAAAGRPIQAGLRLLDQTAVNRIGQRAGQMAGEGGRISEFMVRAGERGLGPGQLAIRQAGMATGMSQAARRMGTEITRAQGQVTTKLQQFADGMVKAGGLKIPPDKLVEYTQKIALGDRQGMDQVGRDLYDRYAAYRFDEEAKRIRAGEGVQTPIGFYSTDSAVPKRFRQHQKALTRQGKVEDQLTAAHAEKAAADQHLARATATMAMHSRRRMHTPTGKLRALPISRGRSNLPSSMVWGTQDQMRRLGTARTRVAKAEAAIAHHTSRRELMRRVVDKSKVELDKAIVDEPPRHLHPRIRETLTPLLRKAAEAKHDVRRAETARTGDAATLQAFDHAYANMHTKPVLDDFEMLVGKEETRKLLEDSINAAIEMDRAGFSHPLYVPTVYEADLGNLMAPHRLAQERDLKESQIRKTTFTLQKPLMDLHAAMTKEQAEIYLRKGMQEVWDTKMSKLGRTLAQIQAPYLRAAERMQAAGRLHPGADLHDVADNLMLKDWKRFDFNKFGIKHRPAGGQEKLSDVYLPRDVVDSFESFTGTSKGALASVDGMFQSAPYRTGMKIFRFSVLYGPRHFAHVVVGGLVSMMLEDPGAFRHFPKLWPVFMDIAKGRPISMTHVGGMEISPIITTHFDYRTDPFFKSLQVKAGQRRADLLKEYWDKMHLPSGERIAAIEDAAQSVYQLAVQLNAVKRHGLDPLIALEKARQVVVNTEGMSAFERVVLKQVMPFYTFTRYAVRFLWNLPFEHPLRVSILSSLSNQATEEWGTGLPQTMMTLFFFGQPDAKGNVWSVNLRNANPFRSVANMFTWGGFFSSLNPALTAPLVAAGFNPLEGSGQLYPNLTYDPASGALRTKKPSGGLMAAAEQVVPELGAVDALFGLTDNYRYLLANDKQGFARQIMNDFNIPFQVSQYNMPEVRGKVALNTLRAATQAVTAYKKGGRYDETIGRFSLIPYNGQLIPPQQFDQYWSGLKARYGSPANIPTPATVTANPMANIAQYYASQQTG